MQPSMNINVNNQQVQIQQNQLLQFLHSKYYIPLAQDIICLDSNYNKVNQDLTIKINLPIAQKQDIQYVVLFVITTRFPSNTLQFTMVIDANDKMQRLLNYVNKTHKLIFPGQIVIIKNYLHINSYNNAHGYIVDSEFYNIYDDSEQLQRILRRVDVISQCSKIKPEISRRKYVEFFSNVLNIYTIEYIINQYQCILQLLAKNTVTNSGKQQNLQQFSLKLTSDNKQQNVISEMLKNPNMIIVSFSNPINPDLSKQYMQFYVLENFAFNDREVIYEIIDYLFLQRFLSKPNYIQVQHQKMKEEERIYMLQGNVQIDRYFDIQQNLFQQGKIFGPKSSFSDTYYLKKDILFYQDKAFSKKSQDIVYTSPEKPVISGSQRNLKNSIVSISSQQNQIYSITSSKNSDILLSKQANQLDNLNNNYEFSISQKNIATNESPGKIYIYQLEPPQIQQTHIDRYQSLDSLVQLKQPFMKNSFQQLKLQITFQIDGFSQMGSKLFGSQNALQLKSAKIVFPRLILVGKNAYLINIQVDKVLDSFPNIYMQDFPKKHVAVIKQNVIKQIFSQFEGKTTLLVQKLNVLCVQCNIRGSTILFIVDIARKIDNFD